MTKRGVTQMMHVVFVHGWSVQNTDTYGALPQYLDQVAAAEGRRVSVANVFLGKYVSFEDTVNVDDIARAFDAALRDHPTLRSVFSNGDRFACITHSTGGPVVRQWFQRYYEANQAACPMSHLIMLAPANHGSALAQLGKGRLSRIKTFFEGVAPGQRVLDWLELGSDQGWALNARWLDYDTVAHGVYPFVLQGQSIDRKLYDVLNSYTDEVGSDGVVRVAGANMNYSAIRLRQADGELVVESLRHSPKVAMAVLPGLSHSGEDMGIIRSVMLSNAATHPTVKAVLQCLAVDSPTRYSKLVESFAALSAQTQRDEESVRAKVGLFTRTFATPRCTMLVFRIVDDTGLQVTDYDLVFTAGATYDEYSLPPGFFVDRQRNLRSPGKLTYYMNHDVLREGLGGRLENRFGMRVSARPNSGLAHYGTAEFRGTGDDIVKAIRANETLMVEIVLQRKVDRQVFTLTDRLGVNESISDVPSGTYTPSTAPVIASRSPKAAARKPRRKG